MQVRRRWLAVMVVVGLCAPAQLQSQGAMASQSLGQGRFANLHALLEKTLLRLDVLTLDIRVGRATAERLAALIDGQRYSRALADQAARVLIGCDDALARMVFLRNISAEQFLDGIRDNLGHALRAGILSRAQHGAVAASLPQWFAFLRDRGIHQGDVLLYRIRGDTVRTQFWSNQRRLLLDRVDLGAGGRLGLMGGYFAPGSDLREGLLRSLF